MYGESGDLEGIRKILDTVPCCAILLEMIQGEGGVLVQDKAFVQGLAQLAGEHKLSLAEILRLRLSLTEALTLS